MKFPGSCLVLCLVLSTVTPALAGEFSADVTRTEGKSVRKGTLHVKDGVYRLEFPDPAGPTLVSIHDPKGDTVRVLVPRYETYMEDKQSGILARMNDPFAGIDRIAAHYEKKDAGTETLDGYECTKETYGDAERVIATVWRSTRLGFPLKFYVKEDWHVVVSNVKEGPVDPRLMAVPEGWALSDRKAISEKIANDPEMKAKREAWERCRPREMEFTQRLEPGTEAVFLLGEVTNVTAGVKYDAPECRWTLVAHRGGDVLEAGKEPRVGKSEVTWVGDGEVPDRLVVRCAQGEAWFGLKLVGKLPLLLAKRAVSTGKGTGGPSWSVKPAVKLTTLRFANGADAAGNAKLILNLSDGKGKSDNRVAVLKPGESKLFEIPASEGWQSIGYTMQFGEVKVEVVEDYREAKDRKPF